MTPEERMASLSKLPFEEIGTPAEGARGFWAQTRLILKNRGMLGLFVKRDLKSRYKDSALGFAWTLVKPLTQIMIYYLVIGQFLGAERGIPQFAIYIFTGLTAYGLFSEIVMGGTASILGNAGLVKKVYLPRELFPLAAVGGALFNFLIQLGILLIATLLVGAFPISPGMAYFLPSLIVLLLYSTALALLLSALNVYLRDVQYLVEVIIMVMMWASPILYSWKMVADKLVNHQWIVDIYTNNPITLAVLGFQRSFWMAGKPVPGVPAADQLAQYPADLALRLMIAGVIGCVCVYLAQRVFARLQGNFAQML
ncbi:ABC transporter permease [Mycetocola spongiae]|uniref:ABC transporter permease n=1 Tax=Mycetocola spongiae TaxID=2859226 RepID=UPI001CF3BE66|nr:ABC transporter permease [Mycetocola spongiae]UCR90341.1 ABC transporter permease [Mycetocola spongiae]